jgi:NADPH-dependent glutamate synthase beta subunit-like oxidoreductase
MSHHHITIQDIERVAPFSRGSTEIFKTGQWSSRKPVYIEKTSPCTQACPAGNNIPGALAAAGQGDFDHALELILAENPLPGICGRVCYHPCQPECNRSQFDEAVEIRSLERAIADFGTFKPSPAVAPNPRRVAVVGSGPAGLSAAYFLARMGHTVSVIESKAEPGGVLRYGIPEYRLPKDLLSREIERITSLGIALRTNSPVDRMMLDHLRESHDYLFLSTGAWLTRKLRIEGERRKVIVHGLDFLSDSRAWEQLKTKKRILVIGGGDVAVDVARTALRLTNGAAEVTMVAPEKKGEFPAIPEGLREAHEEGIAMIGSYRPVSFYAGKPVGVRLKRTRVERDPSTGAFLMHPARGKDLELQADFVIVAIGQAPSLDLYEGDLLGANSPSIYVDAYGMTPVPGVYAGGDLTPERPAVVDAIASGKRAALSIHLSSMGNQPADVIPGYELGAGRSISMRAYYGQSPIDLKKVVQYGDLNTLTYRKAPPLTAPTLPRAERRTSFTEVGRGLDRAAAIREANRCFYCGTCVQCDLCFLLCPDISIQKAGKDGYSVKADYCKGCSMCASSCPRNVIEMGGGR